MKWGIQRETLYWHVAKQLSGMHKKKEIKIRRSRCECEASSASAQQSIQKRTKFCGLHKVMTYQQLGPIGAMEANHLALFSSAPKLIAVPHTLSMYKLPTSAKDKGSRTKQLFWYWHWASSFFWVCFSTFILMCTCLHHVISLKSNCVSSASEVRAGSRRWYHNVISIHACKRRM